MPILLIVLIAILIAQIGFWDTFGALLGAVAMLVLFVVVAIGAVLVAGALLMRRTRRRF
ncbi:hypothetical protein VQ042_12085 [Aurantimonas sp. A2-1-M11]|uniref:hypothetical protein n=1 Tax=Aurantimonas sp. A2-1-M11 TaxID=3113712 RepID=UPI002F95A290